MAKARDIPELERRRAVRATPRRASCACARDELFDHADERARHERHRARARHARGHAPPARRARDLRAVLPASASTSGVLRDVKALADALGERRDPDVHIDALEQLRRGACRPPTARASSACVARAARRARPRPTSVLAAALDARASDGPARAPARAGRPPRGARGMKARKVKGLDPTTRAGRRTPSGSSACGSTSCARFMPRRRDPSEVEAAARHAHRRQAPALRARAHRRRASAPYARTATKRRARTLQDLLGEIHDCDVQMPRASRACVDGCAARTPTALVEPAGDADDLDAGAAARRRAPRAYARARGAARSSSAARRIAAASSASSSSGRACERKGFRARLEYAR